MNAPPPEVPSTASLTVLAPKFCAAVIAILSQMGDAKVAESLRTPERQAFLYGFGRDYDDGRGVVTQAETNLFSWHGFGLAVDIVHVTREWNAGQSWFTELGRVAKIHDCTWGGDWRHPDLPHVQWGVCRDTPSDRARELFASGGLPAVWTAVEAA